MSTTGLKSFDLREKFSKRFSFGGDSVRLFLLCLAHVTDLFIKRHKNI